ncbi:MAG: TIM barrel protein [Candidatus Latescibacteria bacterium]|nr:TIM barrel protein [Candidatus Latescibacterota bacterium]
MMKIGTRISPDWLDRPDDLAFLKQIGVDVVDITLNICPGYAEAGGRANVEGLEKVVEAVEGAGLKVERANTANSDYINTFLGREGSEREIENLQVNAGLCGQFGFPVMGIQCFQATQFGHIDKPMHDYIEGRGGYQHMRMNLTEAAKDHPAPPGAPTADQVWERTLNIFREVVPVAESAGVQVAMHGNDPPVPSLFGVPQVLIDFAAFDRLFAEVPSANNGMTFCVGTRYESGQDIYEGIRHFGAQNKIFHVHFRNVAGTIPQQQGYAEVIPDSGDLDMYQVAKALHEVGYQGAIDYDHIMRLTTDDAQGRQYIAFCVGHMRGILQSLASES